MASAEARTRSSEQQHQTRQPFLNGAADYFRVDSAERDEINRTGQERRHKATMAASGCCRRQIAYVPFCIVDRRNNSGANPTRTYLKRAVFFSSFKNLFSKKNFYKCVTMQILYMYTYRL